MKRTFRKASARKLLTSDYVAYISTNLRLETLVSVEAQNEKYIYHAAEEALFAALVACFPPNMIRNSRIAYCVVEKFCPDTQGDIMRRLSVIKRDVSSNTRLSRSEPQNPTKMHQNSTKTYIA